MEEHSQNIDNKATASVECFNTLLEAFWVEVTEHSSVIELDCLTALLKAYIQIIEGESWEILPCPFCGSECGFESTTFGDSAREYFRVRCNQNEHALDGWYLIKDMAVEEWNCRFNGG